MLLYLSNLMHPMLHADLLLLPEIKCQKIKNSGNANLNCYNLIPLHCLNNFIFPIPIYVYPAGNTDTPQFPKTQAQKIKTLLLSLFPIQTA